MKTRFTPLDLCAVVKDLRSTILGLRVANIYDINPKTYLLKLVKPDTKIFLLIESGIRIHTTEFSREKSQIPSVFSLKLRKHIRTKRVEDVQQLGNDRIVMLTFGSGAVVQHLIVEFYASGNVILTDGEYNIQTLLRTHKFEEENVLMAVNQKYPLSLAKNIRKIVPEEFIKALMDAIEKSKLPVQEEASEKVETKEQETQEEAQISEDKNKKGKKGKGKGKEKGQEKGKEKDKEKKGKKKSKAVQEELRQFLTKSTDIGSLLVDHCILSMGYKLDTSFADYDVSRNDELVSLIQKLELYYDHNLQDDHKGYILLAEPKKHEIKEEQVAYEEYTPYLFKQFQDRKFLEFPTFDKALDEFYSKVESQKVASQIAAQEDAILKKLDYIKKDQVRRIEDLKANEELNITKAQLIETNLTEVDQALMIVRSAVASGMDWKELNRLVKEERKKGNPIANIIHKLKLETNQITLLLSAGNEDDDDLVLPAQERKSATKAQKTADAAQGAIKAAEKKTRGELKEVKAKAQIQHIRKQLWFEKFHWFITTDNYLVISGKDAQQNELLYKRYLKKGDIYVHADIHGASSCIIKNPTPDKEIPPNTLLQAGCMSVCRSAAWKEKIVASAYWVYDSQVSKSAPTGEYLTTGSFMIRGPLVRYLRDDICLKLHESCVGHHLNERKKQLDQDTQSVASETPDMDEVDDDGISEKTEELELDGKDEDEQQDQQADKHQDEQVDNDEEQLDKEQDELEGEEKEDKAQDEQVEHEASGEEKEVEKEKSSDDEDETNTIEPKDIEKMKAFGFGISSSAEQEEDEGNVDDETKKERSGRRRLTAREKRLLKKGKDPSEVANTPSQEKNQPAEQPKKEAPKQIPRGKKGKLKKLKSKYAEQDEEERELKMKLLGSQGNKEAETKKVEQKPNKGPTPKPQEKKVKQSKPKEPKPQPDEEEDRGEEEEEALQEKLGELDSLTGSPLPKDVLLFAIPVCAPYAALNGFKYKVKLTPGAMKKGKAAKTAVSFFLHSQQATQQEKDMIKAVPDPDVMQQMIGEVKVATPGLFQQQKKKKK